MSVAVRATTAAVAPDGPPPAFRIETELAFLELEVASDPVLFNGSLASRRTKSNFFSTGMLEKRRDGDAITVAVDLAAWRELSRWPALYYRAHGSADARGPREATVADAEWERAPALDVRRVDLPTLRARLSGDLQWLRVDGNRVVDQQGQAAALRGVSRTGFESTAPGALDPTGVPRDRSLTAAGISRDEIREIVSDWGANVVALPINQQWALTQPEYVAGIDRVVTWAAAEGAYTLVSLRWLDAEREFGTTATGQTNRVAPLPDENSVRLWRKLASRYKGEPAVLYDLFSAPHEPLADDQGFLFDPPADAAGWLALWHAWVQRIGAGVHRVHARALLFVSGWDWGLGLQSFPVQTAQQRPLPNAVYSSHVYLDDRPERSTATADEVEQWLGGASLSSAHPVFVGGWGGEADDVEWGRIVEARLRERGGAGWTAWSWGDEPPLVERRAATRTASGTTQQWRTFVMDGARHRPTEFGTLVRDALRTPPPRGSSFAPVPPPRPPLELEAAVGPDQPNAPGDVRALQDRLVELGYLSEADAAAERPGG